MADTLTTSEAQAIADFIAARGVTKVEPAVLHGGWFPGATPDGKRERQPAAKFNAFIKGSGAKVEPVKVIDRRKLSDPSKARAASLAARKRATEKRAAKWRREFTAAPTLETIKRLADDAGVTVARARKVLGRLGFKDLPRNQQKVSTGRPRRVDRAEVVRLYTEQRLTPREIALAIGCSAGHADDIIRTEGVERKRGRRPDVSLDQRIAAFYVEGWSLIQTRDAFKLASADKVRFALQRCGITLRHKHARTDKYGLTPPDMTGGAE